jgi:hypothetical protein
MKAHDLNITIKMFYQLQEYDEILGENSISHKEIFNYDVFANVTNTSFTAFFKFKELGNNNIKRFNTIKFDIDETKTIIIEYNSKKYKVLKFEEIDDEFMQYDAELVRGDDESE